MGKTLNLLLGELAPEPGKEVKLEISREPEGVIIHNETAMVELEAMYETW